MTGYWPWWAGALALGAIATLHARLSGRPLGVSGTMASLADPKRAIEEDRLEGELTRDRAALEAAMLAATVAEFGPDSVHADSPEPSRALALPPAPFAGNVAFVVMAVVGALIAALVRGTLHVSATLGPAHEHLFGHGPLMFAALGVGGLLVGVGTRMSGGCTSGHGLSGCARLAPSSLVATATFLGTAVGTSFLLAWVMG